MEEQGQYGLHVERKLETIEEYKFEPIKGYPMLHWKGKRPFTSTQYYPAQLKENHGEPVNGWMNRIYWGDNLQVMSHLLKEFRGKIDLIYIDPPFDSKADYKKKISLKGVELKNDRSVFEEKQYTDIWVNDEYLQFMYERLILLRELLSDTGSIFLHCDYRKSHQLRCLLDEVFGASMIVNEIIWHYRRWSNVSNTFQKMHDTLLLYSKTSNYNFNLLYQDYAHPEWIEDTVRGFVDGKLVRLKDENGNYLKREQENKGVPMHDVWEDINFIGPTSSERVDYPTQKPLALLERLINTCTDSGHIVFDAFMGSGTTQLAALKLGRKFIGADINLGAVQMTTKRLIDLSLELKGLKENDQTELQLHTVAEEKGQATDEVNYYGFSIFTVNNYDIFRNPIQAKEILIQALEIQPLPGNTIYDGEKDGKMVKIMPINRIATRADLNDLITGFNYREFEKRQEQSPGKAVESLLLVCMGHEPDLGAMLQREVPFKLEVEVVDILRDKSNLEFKRDAEARIVAEKGYVVIQQFYPMNFLQKLSMRKENVEDWKELVESVMIDFNYDGAVFEPAVVDVPEKNEMVVGRYEIPYGAGTIRVKITDLLSESLEVEVPHGR